MAASPTAEPVVIGPGYFDAMFEGDDDPWRFKTRWYEERKRALTLASLPSRHYASAYEPGCANGELSAALAARCARLLCTDGNARAVHLARERLAGLAHVEVRPAWLPQAWPEERFDLIVISELGYFFEPEALALLADRARASLNAGGTVLACHWRRPIEGCVLTGDAVHEQLHHHLAMPLLSRMVDDDLRLEVWCLDARSVGEREGLR